MAQHVREVMTASPMTVEFDTPVHVVARLMRDGNLGSVVVAEAGRVAGLVTDRDLVVRVVAAQDDAGNRPVREACSTDLVTVGPEDEVDEVIRLMRATAVRRVPVVEQGRAIGIVSLGDLAIERDPGSALGDISAAEPNH